MQRKESRPAFAPGAPRVPLGDLGDLGGSVEPFVDEGLRYREPGPSGTIDGAAVAGVVNGNRAIKACDLVGSAVVRLVIDVGGNVVSASLQTDRLTGDKACLLEALRRLPFPRPTDTAAVLVPFVFRK